MDKRYYYSRSVQVDKNVFKKEIVSDDDALDYALDKLGITITPLGISGSYTQEQLEVLDMLEEWYYSGEWCQHIEGEKINGEDYFNENDYIYN